MRHKARLVAKGFTQIPGRDYDQTYSPVMDVITYRYLIAFAIHYNLTMHQLDIVTAYLYGHLDTIIHMEAPSELLTRVIHHIQGEQTQKEATTHKGGGPFGHTNKAALQSTAKAIGGKIATRQETDQRVRTTRPRFAVQILRSMYGLK